MLASPTFFVSQEMLIVWAGSNDDHGSNNNIINAIGPVDRGMGKCDSSFAIFLAQG